MRGGMKNVDLGEYNIILNNLGGYFIYEHPKTFHHVMVVRTERGENMLAEQVAQWSMPGLAMDEDILVPPGFIREVIKQLGMPPVKPAQPRANRAGQPGDYIQVPDQQRIDWRQFANAIPRFRAQAGAGAGAVENAANQVQPAQEYVRYDVEVPAPAPPGAVEVREVAPPGFRWGRLNEEGDFHFDPDPPQANQAVIQERPMPQGNEDDLAELRALLY